MFVSQKWTTSNHATKNEDKQMVNIIICDDGFWKFIQYCLKCVTTLMKISRLVNGDSKPNMSYIYKATNRVKEKITVNFKN